MSVQVIASNGVAINGDATANALQVILKDNAGNSLAVNRGSEIPTIPTAMPVAGINDGSYRILRLDRIGSVRPGFDTMLFHDDVEGTTINSQLWTATATTFANAQSATTGIDMNSASGLAANSTAQLLSQRQFSKMQMTTLRMRIRTRVIPAVNSLQEFGFGQPSGVVAQIPTGAFWRYASGGSIIPVLAYNGSNVVQGTDIAPDIVAIGGSANYYTWGIIVDDDNVLFTCQDVSTGKLISEQTLQLPLAQPKIWSATHLPIFARNYVTTSAAPFAPRMYISDTMVTALDMVSNRPWAHQQAAIGSGAEVHPTTFAQTSQWANSAAPANATLSNTVAGYTTLGGLFNFAAPAGAATDYALFAFTVPAPYSFYCTGIYISSYNAGAAVATTATVLQWGVANNSAAVSLATTINRTALCSQSYLVGAAIGQPSEDLDMNFEVPLRTDPGRLMHVIVRVPVGTATASQVISGSVTIRGYFE